MRRWGIGGYAGIGSALAAGALTAACSAPGTAPAEARAQVRPGIEAGKPLNAMPAPLLQRAAAIVPTPADERKAAPPPRLSKDIASFLHGRQGVASLWVEDLRTGRTYGYKEHGRFITASVAKVNILTGLLLRAQSRHTELTGGERSLAIPMIHESDNNAANALYADLGQGPVMSRIDHRLRMRDTEPYPTVWGATRTSPYDQVRLLHVLADERSPLTRAHRRYVLGLMSGVISEQRWGVTAAALPGERVSLKNGWTPTTQSGYGWAVNSIGRITGAGHDFLIAVFSKNQPGMGAGIHTVEHLAKLAVTALRDA